MNAVSPINIRRLDANAPEFETTLAELVAWESVADLQLEENLRDI